MKGSELKILREKFNLTQQQVADAIGTNVSRVSDWENDKHKMSKAYVTIITSFFSDLEKKKK